MNNFSKEGERNYNKKEEFVVNSGFFFRKNGGCDLLKWKKIGDMGFGHCKEI
jgi:hypothetical protein